MQFTPKTADDVTREKKEAAEKRVLPRGEYDFETATAEDTTSKKTGKPMIKVGHKVWGQDGKEHVITDYLMEAMAHKFYHYSRATGLSEQYDSGELSAEDCVGRTGRLKLKVETDDYGTKNAVQDYVVPKPVNASALKPIDPATAVDDDSDSVPF